MRILAHSFASGPSLAFTCCALLASAACEPAPSSASAEASADTAPHTRPQHILPANVAAAEFLAFLVEPERIAGLPEQVDDYSSVSFRAHGFEKPPRFSRYVAEPLIVLAPDLVITHAWQALETSEVLRRQGVRVLTLKSALSFDDIRDTLALLGRELDVEERARAVIADLDLRAANLRTAAEGRPTWRALAYSNAGTGGFAAGSKTTVDTLIRLAGLRNAAAEAGIEGHVPLDFERLLELDPDVIVASAPARDEAGGATRNVLVGTPQLATLRAVRAERIAVLSAGLISSDSPCLMDAAEKLAQEVERMQRAAPAAVKKP